MQDNLAKLELFVHQMYAQFATGYEIHPAFVGLEPYIVVTL